MAFNLLAFNLPAKERFAVFDFISLWRLLIHGELAHPVLASLTIE